MLNTEARAARLRRTAVVTPTRRWKRGVTGSKRRRPESAAKAYFAAGGDGPDAGGCVLDGVAAGSWASSMNTPPRIRAIAGGPQSATAPSRKKRRMIDEPRRKIPPSASTIRNRLAAKRSWRRMPPGRSERTVTANTMRRTIPIRKPRTVSVCQKGLSAPVDRSY